MTSEQSRVTQLFSTMLGRTPEPDELLFWSSKLDRNPDFYPLFEAMAATPEFVARHRVKTAWLPGHFYSPIVDPTTVRDYVAAERRSTHTDIAGVTLDITAMGQFWAKHKAFIKATPFTRDPRATLRYHWSESPYPIGDAVTYRAMINALRPRRIVEIGCGFSTACALDTLDEIGSADTMLTCIEPFPAALYKRVRSSDLTRMTVIESVVQDVPLAVFDQLVAGDILFVDSTHVLKTGSDVHFELFMILPRLKPGVVVHFHDIRWPFEYPDGFIFDRNFSWNEAYAMRALLMFSSRFSVLFYNSLFAVHHATAIKQTFPDFLINPGSSIWIKIDGAN